MTWLNPLAFVGLLATAIPVLVHLFGRRRARRQPFPSLRWFPPSHPNPAAARRPADLLLLALRCAIVAAAVLALAGPRWASPGRAAGDASPQRVILVDTSASLRRLTSRGSPAVDEARAAATALADSSRGALIVETARPGGDLSGAAAWLAPRPGPREVVVLSDFQLGALEDGDLASVPDEIGIRLRRIEGVGQGPGAAGASTATVTASPDGTEATWGPRPVEAPLLPRVLAGEADRVAVEAALAAARNSAAPEPGRRRVAVVFPGAPDRDAMLSGLEWPDSAWLGSLLVALSRDAVLRSIASGAMAGTCGLAGVPMAPDESGAPVAMVAGVRPSTGELVIASCVAVGTLAGAALVARVAAAATGATRPTELEPAVLPDELLRRWERPGAARRAGPDAAAASDGRWLWLVALLLLGVEQWWRDRPVREGGRPVEEPDARAA